MCLGRNESWTSVMAIYQAWSVDRSYGEYTMTYNGANEVRACIVLRET